MVSWVLLLMERHLKDLALIALSILALQMGHAIVLEPWHISPLALIVLRFFRLTLDT